MTYEVSSLPYVAQLELALEAWRNDFATRGWKIRDSSGHIVLPAKEASGRFVADESTVFVGRIDTDPLDDWAWIEFRIKHGTDLHELKEQMLVDVEAFKLKQPYTLVDIGPTLTGINRVVLLNVWDGTVKPNVFWRRWWYQFTGRLLWR
jgi:hypothetical protein